MTVVRHALGIAAALAMIVAPGCAMVDSNCSSKCPNRVHLLASCPACTINGAPPTCDAGTGCSLRYPPAGKPLVVPLDWNTIGSNTGLDIYAAGADLTRATLLFDGAPASGCTFGMREIQCTSVPQTVQSLSFSYPSGHATFLEMTMSDLVCAATQPPCQF